MWGYKWFFKRTALETSNYLKDDCLKLKCKIGVKVSASEYARLHLAAVPAPAPESELGSHFGALLENQEASDVIFDVGGEKFHAHKLVLAARSPVLEAKISDSSEQNNEVLITEMEPRVFKAMLHYIYRDTLPDEEPSSPSSSSSSITETLTERLLAVADAYGLPRMRLLCESKLWRNISVDTVASTLSLAESCHATDLKAACLNFAAENLAEVTRSEGFEYLEEKCPLLHSELLKTAA